MSEPEQNRWLPGDRYVRPLIRRIVRGTPVPSGVDKVFINLCLGLDRLQLAYEINLPFNKLRSDDRVGILGRGRACLKGYGCSNPIVAGIGLMTHPSEWPTLCVDYPVVKYLQHSDWTNEVYKSYFGDRCEVWPVGIDTDLWQPSKGASKPVDFLIYNKVLWDKQCGQSELVAPIKSMLIQRGLTFEEIRYGSYDFKDYQAALGRSRAMLFLCEHESQGLAYQECLSSGVPILAWDQGQCLDPNRFAWGMPYIAATSVPYWDDRCGAKFKNVDDFPSKIDEFLSKLGRNEFHPREYILDNLTLEKCAQDYVRILDESQSLC